MLVRRMSLKVRSESRSAMCRTGGEPAVRSHAGQGFGREDGIAVMRAIGVWCEIMSERWAEDKSCRASGAKERSLDYLCNGKPLEGFKQGNHVMRFLFLKGSFWLL